MKSKVNTSRLIPNSEDGRTDPRLDKFYDETPQMEFRFQLQVSSRKNPVELYYKERLDGDEKYNTELFEAVKKRAQSDMFNVLTRMQAIDENCEFVSWRVYDANNVMLHQSFILKTHLKPQVGA